MSKGNMLMNLASGKLGSMVFYRAKGEQRTRTYVKTVANPKTVSQMTQRTQLSNLVAMYRIVKILLVKAFPNKKPNQSDYNAFVSRNLNRVPIYITKEMAADQGCVVAPYQVTDGSIAPIDVTGTGINAVTNLFVGDAFVIDATTTVGALSQALIANNQDIVAGMQLSYVSIIQTQSVQTGYPTCTGNYYKMVIDPTSTRKVYSDLPKQAVAVIGGFLGHGEYVADGAFCWILSEKDAKGALNVSPQRLIVTSDDLYAAYSDAAARDAAGMSYGEAPDPFLNPTSAASSQGTGTMIVGSLSLAGSVSKQGDAGPVSLATGATVIIRGSNLNADAMSILLSDNDARLGSAAVIDAAQPLADVLSGITATATEVRGVMTNAVADIMQVAVVGDDRVLLQHTYTLQDVPDPTM